jgi:hypothetical protein
MTGKFVKNGRFMGFIISIGDFFKICTVTLEVPPVEDKT